MKITLYVNKTGTCKFKVKDYLSWYNIYLGIISKDFTKVGQNDVSLNFHAYDVSVDHSFIKKEDILNIYQCLIVKDITK